MPSSRRRPVAVILEHDLAVADHQHRIGEGALGEVRIVDRAGIAKPSACGRSHTSPPRGTARIRTPGPVSRKVKLLISGIQQLPAHRDDGGRELVGLVSPRLPPPERSPALRARTERKRTRTPATAPARTNPSAFVLIPLIDSGRRARSPRSRAKLPCSPKRRRIGTLIVATGPFSISSASKISRSLRCSSSRLQTMHDPAVALGRVLAARDEAGLLQRADRAAPPMLLGPGFEILEEQAVHQQPARAAALELDRAPHVHFEPPAVAVLPAGEAVVDPREFADAFRSAA